MKLMKKLMKKNNKGMSLVELICAIAILGLTTTALGGAMVISARHYQRDSAEFNVQQEAQTATNLIGNLVVDAAEVDWTGNVLTITADGKEHKIYQDGTTLKYKSGAKEGVLAEGVAPNGFTATINKEDATKTNADNVNISLKLVDGQSEYVSNYNATPRNGELSEAVHAEKVCVISIEDEVVIEPNQELEMKAEVLGMDITEVGGLTVTNVPAEWNTGSSYIKYENKKIKIKAPHGASGDFKFLVQTVNNKPNGTEKLAQKEVQLRVRRVDGITINKASGDAYTAGSEYVFAAAVSGSNMSKGFGKAYDYNDYMNPKHVYFEITGVDYEVVEDKSKSDVPYIKIRLKQDMVANQTFNVTATAAHAKGTIGTEKYNKTGIEYADIKVSTSVTCPYTPPSINPLYPVPELPSGMLRGEDYTWTSQVSNGSQLKSELQNKYNTLIPGLTMHYEWYVSFKEEGAADTEWTAYHATCQSGDDQKIDGTWETTYMLPDKAYDIRFFILYYDLNTKQVLYPHDEKLFEPGKGFYEAGFTKGWPDSDAAATDFIQYGRSTKLPATSMYYYNYSGTAEDDTFGMVEGMSYDYVGTKDNPLTYKYGDGKNSFQVCYNMRHLSVARTMYTYTPVVWKLEGTDNWKKLSDAELGKIMKCEISGGTPRYIDIKEMQNYANTDDLKAAACGTYRIGIELGGTAKEYVSDKADSTKEKIGEVYTGFKDVVLETMKLYDETSDKGFIYFKIEK